MRSDDKRLVLPGSPFFESGASLAQDAPLIDLTTLPHDWRVRCSGWWTHASPADAVLPDAGWKIHVSASISTIEAELLCAVDILVDLRVPFKVLSSTSIEQRSRSKFAAPQQVGKVLVAYPRDDDCLATAAEALHKRLSSPGGPRILGEVRIGDGPVYLRFGSFRPSWLAVDGAVRSAYVEDGRLVPDHRGPGARRELPAPVTDLLARFPSAAEQALPLTEPALIYRSGAGAVYSAQWRGESAVVKEARRDAGLDAGGSTGPDRLRHEAAVLRRLYGTGCAPELLDFVELPDSSLLVMSRLPGDPLHRFIATSHPPAVAAPDQLRECARGYRRWADRVVDQVESAVRTLHEHGVVHGDVAPQNVLVAGDQARLIDFESAALDGAHVAQGIATPGFGSETASATADLAAVAAMRDFLLSPLITALHDRPHYLADLPTILRREGERDMGEDQPATPAVDVPALCSALVTGLLATADLTNPERIFPCGAGSFAHPVAALSVSHGAAGVIAALMAIGQPVPSQWLDALTSRALDAPAIPGAGEGLHGVARVLAEAGCVDESLAVLHRVGLRDALDHGWPTGLVGRALCQLLISMRAGRSDLVDEACAAMQFVSQQPGVGTGLKGASGVALSLTAAADLTGQEDWRTAARRLIDAEPVWHNPTSGAALSPVGTMRLPALGEGIAAQAVARRELGMTINEPISMSLRTPVAAVAGLYQGRAGMLVGLESSCAAMDPAIERHRQRLAWYACTLAQHPEAVMILGDASVRLSADVATGSAGVLAALHGPNAVLRTLGLQAR